MRGALPLPPPPGTGLPAEEIPEVQFDQLLPYDQLLQELEEPSSGNPLDELFCAIILVLYAQFFANFEIRYRKT